ncbi:2-dehydro-3-deoxygalactonokinase [Polaromonas sp. JS666]|uniref:2-dehydro-3-deoxygalactonokinase n=1 Tax=Polaromonas sp. (strain JS666 / ATCC BAA-500) TaxID=296591 RepID=UPI0000464CEA|nr:2-dehydro-3-deoxygalactonokinase [Polaromonas sp. JS666]ABE45442.1 2-keto-3-deoxygalactonate kinase [Polaromonas sp. JS666]
MSRLLAVDWGTSSLRGALLAPDGKVVEQRTFARGILTVAPGEFPAVFDSCFGAWMNPETLCLISGMAGSQQGWLEAPYCPCPAGFDDIAGQLAWVEPGLIAIVPGLSIETGGVPDVMRGEETQVFGALQLLGLDNARLVLPGTHSKWVTVSNRRVTDFSTWMTGEFYALLRQHSILARTLPATDPAPDAAAFEQGVAHALRSQGLLHTAFSTRTLSLFKRMATGALPSYLSGLVIGEELKSQSLQHGDSVVVMGAPALTSRYEQALALLGVSAQRVSDGATWRGLRAIADTLPQH